MIRESQQYNHYTQRQAVQRNMANAAAAESPLKRREEKRLRKHQNRRECLTSSSGANSDKIVKIRNTDPELNCDRQSHLRNILSVPVDSDGSQNCVMSQVCAALKRSTPKSD